MINAQIKNCMHTQKNCT